MRAFRIVFGAAFLVSCAVVVAGCGEANEGDLQSTAGQAPTEPMPSDYEAYSSGGHAVTGGDGAPDYGAGYGN